MDDIALAEVQQLDIEQLRPWLQAEHVRRWFPNADAVLEWACDVPENGRQRLIVQGDAAIGYLRWTYVPRGVLDSLGFDDLPSDSADIDLLIGDEGRTGRGIGRRALELAIDEIRNERVAKLAALTTSVANSVAHKAFARAGFRIDREYTPDDFGRCYLMTMHL